MQTSVLYHVIKNECIAYNKTQPKENMAGYEYADFNFRTDDYTSLCINCDCENEDMYGLKKKGILLDTGCCLADEYVFRSIPVQ